MSNRRDSNDPGSANPAELFARALQHHGRQEWREAEAGYRNVLALDPRHVGSLHHLGLMALQHGRADMAADLIGRAIALDGAVPECHYHIGIAFGMLGRFPEAEAHNRTAIQLKPSFAEAHSNLGNALKSQGKPHDAIASYRRALELAPQSHEAHYNLANVLSDVGQGDDAVAHYDRALALRPDYVPAHNNLGALLVDRGDWDKAAAHFEQALRLRPDFAEASGNYGALLLKKGDPVRALEFIKRAFDVQQTPKTKVLLFQWLTDPLSKPYAHQVRDELMRALSEPWGDPRRLRDVALCVLTAQNATVAECLRRTERSWPARPTLPDLGPTALAALANDPLLQCILVSDRTGGIEIEPFLTALRADLLDAAARTGGPSDEHLALHCALARQCFLNEYVFAISEEEREQVGRITDDIGASLASGLPVPPKWIAAVASYGSLLQSPHADTLLGRPWPAPLDVLLTQQIRQPRTEQALAASMPSLTPIDDTISLKVRQQYEENPYPRWQGMAGHALPVTLPAYLRARFPHARVQLEARARSLDYLIAGCGTGRQVAQMGLSLTGIRLSAIDLSRASLGYAKRATDEMKLDVSYAQADILSIGSAGKSFDVIDCTGVLHHMADPWAGWRALLSVLRPGGCMRVALYSATAHRDIVATRAWIAERGFGPTPDDIRRCRQELLALPDGAIEKGPAKTWDFQSLSECRDLLFHVQEHRLELPQIGRFLAENGLELIGLEVDDLTQQRYAERFPGDKTKTDLDNWHGFERDNPDTFRSMVQFWVQRTTGDAPGTG